MPARTSSNHVGSVPSSIANSKFVSHWMASWSWGTAFDDGRDLIQQPRLVDRLDHRLMLRSDERAYRGERRRERYLEADVRGDDPVALEPGEHLVRGDGRLGVAEVLEAQRGGGRALPEAQARQRAVRVVTGRAHLELRA